MTTQELINYYANLLIIQYLGKARAYAHIQTLATPVVMPQVSIQTISFSGVAVSGVFVLTYNGNPTASINWNDSAATIQGKLQAVTGLGSVTVSGSIASQLLTITFTGVTPPALPLVVTTDTLLASGSVAVSLTVLETDEILPLAVQDAYNLFGDNIAQGTQLDVIGKYVGASRNGYTLTGPITLDDSDFLTIIQVAIIRNASGSSLSEIQNLLHTFFAGTILVFDFANMHMDYFFDSALGSRQLAEFFVVQNVLPKPMGVQLGSLIYSANITSFFGFRTYLIQPANITGFNSYSSYTTDTPWLSYADAIVS